MGLYLGSSGKRKLIWNSIVYRLNYYSKNLILNGVLLKSSDNYILKDKNGVYLTAKKEG